MKVDPRFTKASGVEVFTGNELLVKGCLETAGGTHLWTGYPGSPVAGFFDTAHEIRELLAANGVRATMANNEALGAAMVNGSQMHGLRAIAVQKSVGLHVGADALALGNLVGAHPDGGAVIVLGDDPWSDSTQVPADSRFLCKHLMMPVMEPSDAQELKDWVDLAFKLSRESELYIGYLVTTNQGDGGGSVETRPNQFPVVNTLNKVSLDTAAIDFERNVLLPPRTWRKEQNLPKRFARLWKSARKHHVQKILPASDPRSCLAKIGLITSAAAYCYLEHALAELGLSGRIPILKLGITYPLDPSLIEEFAADKTDVIVIEERRGFLEEQVVEVMNRVRQGCGVGESGREGNHGFHGLHGKQNGKEDEETERGNDGGTLRDGYTVPRVAKLHGEKLAPTDVGGYSNGNGVQPDGFSPPQNGGPSHNGSVAQVWGKRFPFGLDGIPETRGLNPSKLIDRLGRLFLAWPQMRAAVDTVRIQKELDLLHSVNEVVMEIAQRTPTFCPGCPHRDSASVLVEIKKQFRDPLYMQRIHGIAPVDLVFHGDTGCYTMLMFEPTKDLMHNYSGMGLGGGTGAGIDPFIRNKQVVFMGDSTFFHSGQLAISNSLKNHQDITYIILDNKTTAMTGHQTTPGLEEGLMGESTFAQNIERVVSAIADQSRTGATVVRVNPTERETYRALLEKTMLQDGVKVLVADKECGITFHRREAREERKTEQKLGFLPEKRFINITQEVCENCLECTKATGCPGLTFEQTPFGRKVQIDSSWCVSDGACTRFMVTPEEGPRMKACPSFEEVTVKRSQKPRPLIEHFDFAQLPAPATIPIQPSGVWHGYLAGVGGMGIGTATAILVLAGHREGYRVQFCDKKGLAIRNGGVYSMITYSRPGASYTSNLIPYGKADLILGVDVLEAARAIDPVTNQRVGSKTRSSVVVNTHKTPTILTLLGKDDFQVEQLEALLKRHTRADLYCSHNVSAVSEKVFGTQLYANILMLGMAWQRGLIPLGLESLEWAIQSSFGPAAARNLQAFQLGRLVTHNPEAVEFTLNPAKEPRTLAEVLADKVDLLTRAQGAGQSVATAFQKLVEDASKALRLSADSLGEFALRVYDLIQFKDLDYARSYAQKVQEVHALDRIAIPPSPYPSGRTWGEGRGEVSDSTGTFEATKAVIWNLHKVMIIKDEVYVAHLLTSEEKHRRDRARYNVDPARGDKIEYKHLNRPQFRIFGRDIAWDMNTRDWMLNVVKRMKWLRGALPDWHREEKDFRDWYTTLLGRFGEVADDPRRYEMFLRVLRLPEMVTGYREIRYPKMAAARQQGELWLQELMTPHSPAVAAMA